MIEQLTLLLSIFDCSPKINFTKCPLLYESPEDVLIAYFASQGQDNGRSQHAQCNK